jgi:hypothetical protein
LETIIITRGTLSRVKTALRDNALRAA